MFRFIFYALNIICSYTLWALPLSECVALALNNNPTFQKQRLEEENAKLGIPLAQSAFIPQLKLDALTNTSKTHSNTNQSLRYHTTKASLVAPIFNAKAIANYQKASLSASMAKLLLIQQRQILIRDTSMQYFNLLALASQYATLAAEKKEIDRKAYRIEQQFAAGTSTKAQVLLLQSAKARIDAQLSQALSQFNVVKNQFQMHLGHRIDYLHPLSNDINVSTWSQQPTKDILASVLNRNIALSLARMSIQQAKIDKKATGSDNIPTVSLSASTEKRSVSNGPPTLPSQRQHALTLSIQSNLSAANAVNLWSARKKVAIEHKHYQAVHENVQVATENEHNQLQSLVQQMQSEKVAISSQQEVLRTSEESLKLGLMTLRDVLTTLSDLQQSQTAYVLAQLNALRSVVLLKELQGTLDTHSITALNGYFSKKRLNIQNLQAHD